MWNGEFAVPVQNRYATLAGRETNGEFTQPIDLCNPNNNNNTTTTRQAFAQCSLEDKMLHIFDELRFVRSEQVNCSRGMNYLQQCMSGMNDKLSQVIETTNTQTEVLKTLTYKSIDMEARSRRNNLIIRGVSENYGENCAHLVFDFLKNHLDIDPRQVYIARAHRLGRKHNDRQSQCRPIIVNFRDYHVVELIMYRVTRLRGSNFSIDHDYPREINEARSRLWSNFKDLKRQYANSNTKVQIVYPAKLVCDGRIIRDELPDWGQYVNTNRLHQVYNIDNINNLPIRKPTDNMADTQFVMKPACNNTGSTLLAASVTQSTTTTLHGLNKPAETLAQPTQSSNIPTNSLQRTDPTDSIVRTESTVPKRACSTTDLPRTDASNDRERTIATNDLPRTGSTSDLINATSTDNSLTNKCSDNSTNVEMHDISSPAQSEDISFPAPRGRSSVTKAAARSERRSQSAVPYKRQSNSRSRSRANTNRVLPNAKNSTNSLDISVVQTHSDEQSDRVSGSQPTERTGTPITQGVQSTQ